MHGPSKGFALIVVTALLAILHTRWTAEREIVELPRLEDARLEGKGEVASRWWEESSGASSWVASDGAGTIVHVIAAILVVLAALPHGALAGLGAGAVMALHPAIPFMIHHGQPEHRVALLALAAAMALLFQASVLKRTLGTVLGLVAVVFSQLAVLPLLILAGIASFRREAASARLDAAIVVAALFVYGVFGPIPIPLGFETAGVLSSTVDALNRAPGVITEAWFGPSGLTWFSIREPSWGLLVFCGVALIAFVQGVLRRKNPWMWAALLAPCFAALTVVAGYRSSAGSHPGPSFLAFVVPFFALGLGAAMKVRESEERAPRLALLGLVVPLFFAWAASSPSAPESRIVVTSPDPDLVYAAVMRQDGGQAGQSPIAGRLRDLFLADEAPFRIETDTPAGSQLTLDVARRYHRDRNYSEARHEASRLLESSDPALEDEARSIWLESTLQLGFVDEARMEVDRLEARTDAGPMSLLSAARVLFSHEATEANLDAVAPRIDALLERARRVESADAEILLAIGQLRSSQGRILDALQYFERALELDPTGVEPQLHLARLYYSQQENQEGAACLQRALMAPDRTPEADFALGRLMFDATEDAERGLALMANAIEGTTDRAARRRILGECEAVHAELLMRKSDFERAGRYANQAKDRLGRENARIAFVLGKVAYSSQDLETAIVHFERSIEQEPNRDGLREDLGEALKRSGYQALLRGDRETAVQKFRRVVELAPDGIELASLKNIIESYDTEKTKPKLDRPENAVATSEETEQAKAAYEQGVHLFTEGKLAESKKEFDRSLEILPDNPYAYFYLGRIAQDGGNLHLALREYKKSVELSEGLSLEFPDAYYEYGRLAFESELFDEAKKFLSTFLDRWPSAPRADLVVRMLQDLEGRSGG